MIIVPSFTHSNNWNANILNWIDFSVITNKLANDWNQWQWADLGWEVINLHKLHLLIVWSCAPKMCSTIDQPCKIQTERITNNNLREKWPVKSFAPPIHWNQYGQNEAQQQFHWNEKSVKIIWNSINTIHLFFHFENNNYFWWNRTTGSSIMSLRSNNLPLRTTSGCLCIINHPTWAKKKPLQHNENEWN